MPQLRDLDFLARKWVKNAQNAVQDYEYGVKNPRKDWKTETLGAQERWAQGVQQAIQRRAFGAGVTKAGTEAWQKGAVEKGPQRYAQGVSVAMENWKREFDPYARVLTNLRLPDRGPKGSRQNYERVIAVGTALHEEKLRRLGGGGER